MLGGGIGSGVWARCVSGDRAVVNDAAPTGRLGLHQHHRLLRAKEHTREVNIDDGLPLLEGQLFDLPGGRADPGVVEQDIEPAEAFLDLLEELLDGCGIADIGGDGQRRRRARTNILDSLL